MAESDIPTTQAISHTHNSWFSKAYSILALLESASAPNVSDSIVKVSSEGSRFLVSVTLSLSIAHIPHLSTDLVVMANKLTSAYLLIYYSALHAMSI